MNVIIKNRHVPKSRVEMRHLVWGFLKTKGAQHLTSIANGLRIPKEDLSPVLSDMKMRGQVAFEEESDDVNKVKIRKHYALGEAYVHRPVLKKYSKGILKAEKKEKKVEIKKKEDMENLIVSALAMPLPVRRETDQPSEPVESTVSLDLRDKFGPAKFVSMLTLSEALELRDYLNSVFK